MNIHNRLTYCSHELWLCFDQISCIMNINKKKTNLMFCLNFGFALALTKIHAL
ncbi:hypothetical protein HanIR_Chr06g0277031 [Helianthus annuus]|nr:hypothetical protein HanIR_Chr06g0277031 [Helianthus annuus]